ncbi:MAG: AAA family ATPase, partial [Candidatus Atribacteria bacterium]|nr:AAA family ATPase [Candidatus Atribacteria bacterium]
MKLENIGIENFKTIKNLSVSMTDILIMVGENNCGKSNVLRALDLFYQDSIRYVDEESFCFKNCSLPIAITLTYNRLEDAEKNHPILKNWIFNNQIKVKKIIKQEDITRKYLMQYFGWQAMPVEQCFDLNRFDEFKSDLKKIV